MQSESIYDKLFSVSFGHNFNLSRYTEKRIKCGEVKAPATLVLKNPMNVFLRVVVMRKCFQYFLQYQIRVIMSSCVFELDGWQSF